MPAANPTPLTAAGKAALEAELDRLVERRQEVVKRISETRQEGDLSENAGYHQAREDQAHLEGRVQEIEAILRHAVIIDNRTTDGSIRLGSVVVVEDEFGEACFTIVGPAEADPTSGRLSDQSPVGRSLLGRRAGDTVEAQTPSGVRALRIVRVE
jgi:transcription elongation factor GreA